MVRLASLSLRLPGQLKDGAHDLVGGSGNFSKMLLVTEDGGKARVFRYLKRRRAWSAKNRDLQVWWVVVRLGKTGLCRVFRVHKKDNAASAPQPAKRCDFLSSPTP
jgi:hypothetical protein